MFKILKQNKAFASFVEIIVTSVIFLLAGLGIFTSISMLRPHGSESAQKLEAAYIGKRVLDQLRGAVDASTWNLASSPLAPNVPHSQNINGYIVNYVLVDMPGLDIRQLFMNIYYQD